jgi:catechol 2,3-dioxygenase-like lactoylglutathione lyase family enzyme
MSTNVAAGVRINRAVPQFTVPDVARTAQYYRDVLGFQIASYWDGERASLAIDPPPYFAIVWRDDVQVFFGRGDHSQSALATSEGGYHAYFHVDGVDALAQELRTRGADILDGPEDRVYAQRELVVRDCNGFVLAFGEGIPGRAT